MACGSGGTDPDAAPDALTNTATVGPALQLPLIDGYNHSNETSIAVHEDTVVVAAINLVMDSESTFEPGPDVAFRRVAAWTSIDGGESFGAPVAMADEVADSTDPVVITEPNGTFWLATLDGGFGTGWLYAAEVPADGWTLENSMLAVADKVWLAATVDAVFAMGVDAIYKVGFDGQIVAEHVFSDEEIDRNSVHAYADEAGTAHFLTLIPDVISWDGTGIPSQSGSLPPFDEIANVWTRSGGSIGQTSSGDEWLVRSLRTDQGAPIVLRVRNTAMGNDGADEPITATDGVAFLPAAAIDDTGRLHVVWYDTTGTTGVLRYTRSISADLSDGFLPTLVVDDNACPGDRWYPYSNGPINPLAPPGGRRLREYIGIAVEGRRAYVTWTHAPVAPSRVNITYIDFE